MTSKLLLCSPGDNLEGGISAVVKGIEKGLEHYADKLYYKKIIYGKRYENVSKLTRIFLEFFQLINFIYTAISFRPSIILIETSFDKKTVLRDSIHVFFCKILRLKVALHAHGGSWNLINTSNLLFQLLAKTLLRKVDFLIVTSREEYEIIRETFKNEVKVHKIDNPVHFPYEVTQKESATSQVRVIFASRLIQTKGILDVLEAAKLLRDNKNIIFEIFGKGELDTQIRIAIEKENLQNITLAGSISLEGLMTEYQKGDIFLFPSYHKEGFPMALFFAVGSGLPIIATRVRPLPNFLVEGVNCVWVSEKNPHMISNKIIELSGNPQLMRSMTKANIDMIKKFDPKIIVRQYLELFQLCT